MVWGLFPVDPLPGEDKYYIFSKGTYKLGRRGCDVIINKDKGVSRIHAEIVIDAMIAMDQLQKKSSNISSNVRIRDCSKYGTFINKNLDSKEKVHEFPNRETTLKDGDMVSLGTGNATYRFCFVPLKFFVCRSENPQANRLLQAQISSIGATITRNWSPECTHVVVDDFMQLKEDLFDAIVARKPFVLYNWVEFIAEKSICTEIPNCSSYAPTLMLEGLSVKVADSRSRENCLRGYTFVLESTDKYKFKDSLRSLLEGAAAKVVPVKGFYPDSQVMDDEVNDRVVCVIPAECVDSSECFRKLSSLARVNEINLIFASLSGHLDPSLIVAPPVLITSSCSTDETVVADSDVEMETTTSAHVTAALRIIESDEHEIKEEIAIHEVKSGEHQGRGETTVHTVDTVEYESKRDISTDGADDRLESGQNTCLRVSNDNMISRGNKVDESGSENVDVIYSQNLIVRDTNLRASAPHSSMNGAVLDFKRFRKTRTESGNSFYNLIPFSKYPYKVSDYGSDDVVESVKEEKRRKQMEAVAEDLFNNDKGRRRGAAGSLHTLFARR